VKDKKRPFVEPPPSEDAGMGLQEAHALAQLIEVRVRGVDRPATAADVLELTMPPRYLLRHADGRYVGRERHWVDGQRDALVIDDRDFAHEMAREGRGRDVPVRVIRLRRRGTVGLEGARLRPTIATRVGDGMIALDLPAELGFAFKAALESATEDGGEH
jgi:hypothetical protein